VINLTLVTQKDLSSIIGITARQIRELHNTQGMFNTDGATRKYNLALCVQEYIRYKIENETSRDGAVILDRERAEHERAKKEITRLKLRKMRRELHEALDVEAVLGDMLVRFRSKMMAMPPKLAPLLIGITEANEMMNALKQEVVETLEELSAYNPGDYADVIDDESEDDDEEDAAADS
jgi:hypothetical protein